MKTVSGPDSGVNNRISGWLLLAALTLWLPATAQAIVNIEGQRNISQQEGLSGSLNLSVSGASGNTDNIVISSGGRLNWQRSQSVTFLIARYNYGENNQTRNINQTFTHLRHIMTINPDRAIEGFLQAERNEFTRMSLRALAGAGLRLTVHNSIRGQAFLGLGAFASAETLEERSGLTDSGTERLFRANTYLALDYAINKQVSISSTSYYQPAMDNHRDYRLLEQAALKVSISNSLALKLALDIAHDSLPPQAIDKTDISYHSGIEYTF